MKTSEPFEREPHAWAVRAGEHAFTGVFMTPRVARPSFSRGQDVKTLHMLIEGGTGWANITGREVAGNLIIAIKGLGSSGRFEVTAGVGDVPSQQHAAARLQRELDGYEGSSRDVAEYLRAIQNFAWLNGR